MKMATFLAGCLIASPLTAFEQTGRIITMSEEEEQVCEQLGPCLVLPMQLVARHHYVKVREAYDAGVNAGKDACSKSLPST
jgi:hypothetical protein